MDDDAGHNNTTSPSGASSYQEEEEESNEFKSVELQPPDLAYNESNNQHGTATKQEESSNTTMDTANATVSTPDVATTLEEGEEEDTLQCRKETNGAANNANNGDDLTAPSTLKDAAISSSLPATTSDTAGGAENIVDYSITSLGIVMDLNVAYEALEQVRQANVAIEFGRPLLAKECIACLRDKLVSQQQAAKMAQTESRFKKFMAANKPANVRPAAPCLTCGTPVCPRHRCQALKRENINICVDCSTFFSLDDFLAGVNQTAQLDSSSNDNNNNFALSHAERKQQMNHMLDVYDRVLLVLQYSSRYIDDISTSLLQNTKRNNQIGFGSSATGVVSGIAGVAAAVTIFTPVGPPLLIASILFGGAGTAASAGSEAVNYHCSNNKMCDTIIALHGMLHSISQLTIESSSDATDNDSGTTTGDEAGTDPINLMAINSDTKEEGGESNGTEESTVSTANSTRTASPPSQRRGVVTDDSAKNASARNWTRAAGNALKPLTFGAVSVVSVVAEAREMRSTLDKINAGNPCAKAETLREIGSEIGSLPSTTVLAEACPKFFTL